MDRYKIGYTQITFYLMLSLFILLSGCSDNRSEVLGIDVIDAKPPTVVAVAPVNDASDVPIDIRVITAEFSEPVMIGGSASFTITCEAPCTSPTGAVNMDAANRVAAFTLPSGTPLEPHTLYTGTISDVVSIDSGIAMSQPFFWSFTTAETIDDTRPTVISTQPATTDPGPTADVSTDTAISAVFSEDMDPLTINDNSFTLSCDSPCEAPLGSVSYSVGTRTAVFTPETVLDTSTTYTATITTDATDLAGNELAGNQGDLADPSDYVWRFTTVAAVQPPPVVQPPRVTAVAPLNNATGVAIDIRAVTAEFNEPVTLDSGGSFTVTCEAPCTSPAGSVSMNSTNRVAAFTLSSELEPLTRYTGTISGAVSIASGLTMSQPFVWSFTTGASIDTTRPRVISTKPETTDDGGTTVGVPANTAISAVFSEDMEPLTINDNSFTLTCDFPCEAPLGSVSYSVGSRTAVFMPEAVLESDTTYTATITTEATDLAGNALAGNQEPLPAASDYIWTFTTTVETIPEHVSVLSTQPLDDAIDVCPSATINATFDVPSGERMDPLSITSTTFSVTGPSPDFTPVEATSVKLDEATGKTATFIPLNPLTEGLTYTATILSGPDGVKDLAIPANEMLEDYSWSFTVGPECLEPVDLQTATPFGTFGGTAGMTNEGILTVINGDIGTTATDTSAITGFTDGVDEYTVVPGVNEGIVNGTIYTCAPSTTGPNSVEVDPVKCAIAEQARLDAETAYLELAGLPGGPDPGAGNLANLTLAPGTYTAVGGSFMIEGGDLTLDAQGDANAVWVFQMATTLTVGGPGAAAPQSVILANGAQAKNVFWQVGSAATINAGGGGTMEGTIISQEGVSFSTADNVEIVTLNGRAISLGASVTMVNTVINVPAP